MTAPIKQPVPAALPARPVRFDDPERNAAYWARIVAIVDQAPPLSDEQRVAIRLAVHGNSRRAAA
ncbi:hypothetical protein RVR_5779 [Actinacidiphila reveromycinica]|uniref:Uncharacterized protein n=1 Tax=Actinacidiphila reveromycinica TaxID=659352 RepID=A0A7U3URX1_9ACTN|nr:hypothetical protein [Streptomyces sp. SN-593]BBA99240.1 hypothetical protein RVR_5779 [Streptomyces sp. SN-593]